MKRNSHLAFAIVLALGCCAAGYLALPAVAQNQQPSPDQSSSPALGDYARQVRKDASKDGSPATAKPKVFDNDNLPREENISIVGAPAPETADASSETKAPEAAGESKPAAGASPSEAKSETPGETKAPETGAPHQAPAETKTAPKSPEDAAKERQAAWKQWQEKITAQKDQIDLLQREFEVLQREYQIRAAAFYADAGTRLRNSGSWDKQDADYKQQIADKQKALDDAKQKLDDLEEEARKAGVPSAMREP